jgi:hypothetical protein
MTQTVFTEMSFDDKREQNSSKHIHIHTISTTYISKVKHLQIYENKITIIVSYGSNVWAYTICLNNYGQ